MSTIDDVVKALELSIDVKVANAPSDAPYPVTGTVVSVSKDGTVWVMLDGSDRPTPAERITVAVSKDDRVKGEIHNKMLWITGNMSDIFIQVGSDGETRAASAAVEESVVKNLGKFTADWAYITEFISESITAQEAQIQYIIAHSITTEYLEANYATITSLNAVDAKIDNVESQMVKTEQLVAVDGRIDTLFSGLIKASSLETDAAKAEWLSANYATVNDLDARYTQTDVLDARYATVDFANIVGADIAAAKMKELVARSGWFEDITSEGGTFTGRLTAVELDGDRARFKNIYADALKLLGSDGLYRALNLVGLPSGEQQAMVSEYGEKLEDGLHGSRIIAESITAEQINVDSLLAATLLAQSVQMGATGGMHFESNGGKLSFMSGGRHLDQYEQATTTGAENPSIEAWYELVNGRYVPTEDAAVVSGKTYYYVPGEIAYITANKNGESVFYMTNAIVVRNLNFGQWRWRSRGNGNLNLKWMGVSS